MVRKPAAATAAALLLATHAAAGPCDIYAAHQTPCVAAHSVTRALYDRYAGPLYQLKRNDTGATRDIGPAAGARAADAAAHEAFCGAGPCLVVKIYDQSPEGNHLTVAPPMVSSAADGHDSRRDPSHPVNATRYATTLGGRKVYGAYFEGAMGYRDDHTTGVAVGNEPETVYMVVDGRVYNEKCCFDYGNAETVPRDDGRRTMEAVYFGSSVATGHGAGAGPWVMADLENGLFAGRVRNASMAPVVGDFVTALVTGRRGDSFALKGGDARAGALPTLYDGPRPSGYQEMEKEGAIVLGIGGDNSHANVGVWFEGVMTKGAASDLADQAVQADIAAAGYGK
eukprot:TRINITY_DN32406_c0_g1_i1.p1 TRINITY_DN32406_c0_g1~~TRINITY_DN32406_c0_g1_i1.p1  ORF type:complete len:340 (+),score=127.17 TRINITY_DN32406_c0_g1_i1:61-1080(+)